mgnify:CR=1 FL=1
MFKKGFISGMFDPLHAGHIEIFRQAKEMCEYLIVAVGTDDFIRVRKKHEPLIPFEQRRIIIESIRYIDCVVPIENLDKVAMYKKYNFDVMIAGADHRREESYIRTSEALSIFGVPTVYIERVKDISSTKIKQRMAKLEHDYLVDSSNQKK